jgi:hypothetical protein
MEGPDAPLLRHPSTCEIRRVELHVSRWVVAAATNTATNVHRGAVLPEGRIVVIAVPLAALLYYYFVVRRHRDR